MHTEPVRGCSIFLATNAVVCVTSSLSHGEARLLRTSHLHKLFKPHVLYLCVIHSFIQYSVWRQVQSLLQNDSSIYCIIVYYSVIINLQTEYIHSYIYIYIYTGRFIMFSVITNIYNKKTKGPTLMEFFTVTGKLKTFFWQLEMFDVCTTVDTAHIDTIFKLLPYTLQHVDPCMTTCYKCL